MSERESFIRRILEEPAEDVHRLVYADWLDENGDATDRAHAGFIRHQIAALDHNRGAFLIAFDALTNEFDEKFPNHKGPIEVEWCTETKDEYLREFNKARLLATQTRLRLEKLALPWLDGLLRAILPPEFTDNIAQPLRVSIRTDDWRGWIDCCAGEMTARLLFNVRRGFLSRISYWKFFRIHNSKYPHSEQVLREVFRRHPIEGVRAIDREPQQVHTLHGLADHWRWTHEDLTAPHHEAMLDQRVYQRLPRLTAFNSRYPTRQTAVEDFQYACVALGRELAGLPMLPPPPFPPVEHRASREKHFLSTVEGVAGA